MGYDVYGEVASNRDIRLEFYWNILLDDIYYRAIDVMRWKLIHWTDQIIISYCLLMNDSDTDGGVE